MSKYNSITDLPAHHRANLERQLKLERETDAHDSFAADVRLPPSINSNDNAAVVLAFFQSHGLPRPRTEYRFHETRKFRFDFAWLEDKLAMEIEGGIWLDKGGHNTGRGILRDIEKGNLAIECGWRVLRVVPAQVCTAATVQLIQNCLHKSIETSKIQSLRQSVADGARTLRQLASNLENAAAIQ